MEVKNSVEGKYEDPGQVSPERRSEVGAPGRTESHRSVTPADAGTGTSDGTGQRETRVGWGRQYEAARAGTAMAGQYHDAAEWARRAGDAARDRSFEKLRKDRRTVQNDTLSALDAGRYVSCDGDVVALQTERMRMNATRGTRHSMGDGIVLSRSQPPCWEAQEGTIVSVRNGLSRGLSTAESRTSTKNEVG